MSAAPVQDLKTLSDWLRNAVSRFDEARIYARRESPPVVTVQVKLDKP